MYSKVNRQNRKTRHFSKVLRLTIDRRAVRLAALEDLLPLIGERLATVEPAAGNRWLREMIAAVEVDDRRVTGVRLRW